MKRKKGRGVHRWVFIAYIAYYLVLSTHFLCWYTYGSLSLSLFSFEITLLSSPINDYCLYQAVLHTRISNYRRTAGISYCSNVLFLVSFYSFSCWTTLFRFHYYILLDLSWTCISYLLPNASDSITGKGDCKRLICVSTINILFNTFLIPLFLLPTTSSFYGHMLWTCAGVLTPVKNFTS